MVPHLIPHREQVRGRDKDLYRLRTMIHSRAKPTDQKRQPLLPMVRRKEVPKIRMPPLPFPRMHTPKREAKKVPAIIPHTRRAR